MLSARYEILCASRYDFKSDDGEKLTGTKLCVRDGILPPGNNAKGDNVQDVAADYNVYEKLGTLPGVYDCVMQMGTNGKVRVVDAKQVVK